MNPRFLGAILVFVTVAAHADGNIGSAGFQFRNNLTLAGVAQAGDNSSYHTAYYTPDGAYAAANSFQIELERQRQWAALRERFYEAIGIDEYIPRGSFMTGGLQTNWHLTASTQRTLEFSLDARW
jgi:hypothetical protein